MWYIEDSDGTLSHCLDNNALIGDLRAKYQLQVVVTVALTPLNFQSVRKWYAVFGQNHVRRQTEKLIGKSLQ